jgi:hypothetical protein
VYGIPPEQVVGSSGVVKFEMGPDGTAHRPLRLAEYRSHRVAVAILELGRPVVAVVLRVVEARRRPQHVADVGDPR